MISPGVIGRLSYQLPRLVFVSGGGGGGATGSAMDNFIRADANPISNPMSDGTSTWLSAPGSWTNIQIISNNCLGTSGLWGGAKVSSPTFQSDQEASITIGSLITDIAPGVRMQSANGSGYMLGVINSSSVAFYKVTDSGGLSFSSLGALSVSLSTGDVLTLQIVGSTLTAKVNGVIMGSAVDTTYSTGAPFLAAESDGRITAYTASSVTDTLNTTARWWKFEEGTGTSTVDYSGNGATATLVGSASWVAGKVGNFALYFPSRSAYVTSSVNLPMTQETFAAWVYALDLSGQSGHNIFISGRSSNNWLEVDSSGHVNFHSINNTDLTDTNTVIQTGSWYHLAATIDAPNGSTGTVNIYINGVLDYSASCIGVATNQPFDVGTYGPSLGNYGWIGYVDDVRIYNRALTATEITSLYNYSVACDPSYGNTGGTGNRTGSISVTTTWSGGTLLHASGNTLVNGLLTEQVNFFASNQNLTTNPTITFDFGAPVLITEAKWLQSTTDSQGTWQWRGSNDNSTWTNIGSTFSLATATTTTLTSLSVNTTKYRYYQIMGVSGTSSATPWIYEMEFKLCGLTQCAPSYANNGGTGDRRFGISSFPILVSSAPGGCIPSMQGGGGAGDSAWVDGDTISAGHGFFNGGAVSSASWLQFDFGSNQNVLITEAKFYQTTADAQGTWKWQGSNDASTWTDIGSSFALGGVSGGQVINTMANNITKYRYYRMIGVSGTSNANPWLNEMEFKICGF